MSAAPMDLDRFLTWADETPGRWQLEDGFPVALPPNSMAQGMIHAAFGSLITGHLHAERPGWHAGLCNGIIPRIRGSWNIRVAHVAVYTHPASSSVRYASDPIMIGMVLTPSTERQSWSNVWTCAGLPSLQEIALIDACAIGGAVLRRNDDGTWPSDFTAASDTIELASLGARLPLEAFYEGIDMADG